MDPVVHQLCREAMARLAAAGHNDRRAIIADLARMIPGRGSEGASIQTAYRLLGEAGWESGRKERADKGSSSVSQEELEATSGLVAGSRSRRGRNYMPVVVAQQAAERAGLLKAKVSTGHLCRLLRQAGLDPRSMNAPMPGISRQSQHPNHVWCIDVSIPIHWFFRDEETGEILDFYADADARFYQNKIDNFKRIKRVIHRYVCVDHYSGAYFVWYAYSAGENSADMVDFLYASMAPKGDLAEHYPMHGVPRRIVADQGPGFKSGIVSCLCRDLGIQVELHVPGNAKANGAVETRHHHWSRWYESLLQARGARNLEELNRWAALCCAEYNATLPNTRHGLPPSEKWCTIGADELRECPQRQVFYRLAATTTKTATVDGNLFIRADSRHWQVAGERIYPGCKVSYRLNPFLDVGIRVWDDEDNELGATLLQKDKESGFYTNCHRHVWDDPEAEGATAPVTPGQALARDVKAGKVAVPQLDAFDGLEQRVRRRSYLAARGSDWAPPEAASPVVAEERMGAEDLLDEVIRRLDRSLTRAEGRWWREHIGDGLTRTQFAEAWRLSLAEPALAAVGG